MVYELFTHSQGLKSCIILSETRSQHQRLINDVFTKKSPLAKPHVEIRTFAA